MIEETVMSIWIPSFKDHVFLVLLKTHKMTTTLYVLFEHATGYALFRVNEYEEAGAFIPQVEKATLNLAKFKSLVNFIGFSPYKSGTNALDNINNVSEGILHPDLTLFLETNVPKSSKKNKLILGVADQKIAASIQEALGFSCQHTEVVPEILRGIRLHLPNLIQGLTPQSVEASELSLGRSYSRAKVKFNVNRADNMIIQSISLLDQLDKDINTFSMRLREWYSYHFPELVKIVPDSYTYAKVAKIIGNKKELGDEEELLGQLEETIGHADKAQAVIAACKSSMGMDISEIDLLNIQTFTSKVINLSDYRKQLMNYLISRMNNVAPNLSTLIGETVGARLISHAGSAMNLAKYPASTIQILGAEKALFRALKTRGNTPKYGLIFHSTFIGRATTKTKGRISRYLANKCAMATRIDCFLDTPTNIFGTKLRDQVEERLKFYENGTVPKKNVDVMHEALEAFQSEQLSNKKKKKDKKRKKSAAEDGEDEVTLNDSQISEATDEPPSKKKKKKKKKVQEEEMDDDQKENGNEEIIEEVEAPVKKKKKKKSTGE